MRVLVHLRNGVGGDPNAYEIQESLAVDAIWALEDLQTVKTALLIAFSRRSDL